MIDEAHHLAIVPSGRRMKDQNDFCVGLLKLWLNKVVAKALDEGGVLIWRTAHLITLCIQQGMENCILMD